MLKTRIIPCLDVKDGRVVKGINFLDLIDAGDPVEQAKVYDEQGADEICFLDITASSDNRNILLDTVKKTAEKLTGAGNSNELLNYQHIDRNIIVQSIENNTIYYKLSQTDYDGTTEFFQIIPVEIQASKTHVVSRTDLMGQEVDQNHKGLMIETWNNGVTTKIYNK